MEWPTDLNLKIGDYVILKHAKPIEGTLGTDGIAGDDVILTKDVDDVEVEHCLWQIHVQNQYSAMKEYEDFYYLQMYEQHGSPDAMDMDNEDFEDSGSGDEAEDESNQMLNQLRRAAANENTLNKKLMAMKLGKPLQFGDVFQLCHVQSKKMLTINSTVLAKHERENIRISLHPHGDALSWFEFIPRSKNDREGQQISNNAEAFIRVHERPSEFIHAARKPMRENENIREINCSLESSCWNVCIYQEGSSIHSNKITAGQLISFQEPESSTYLTLEEAKVADGMTTPAQYRSGDEDEEEEEPQINLILTNSSPMSFSPAGDCNIGTNLLWQIEKENRQYGGYVSGRVDRVTFRHLNTGLYLTLASEALTAVKHRQDATFFELHPAQISNSDVKNGILNNSAVQLCEHGEWLRLPSLLLSGMATRSRVSLHIMPEDAPSELTATPSTSSLLEHQDFAVVDKSSATPLRISSSLFQVIGVDLYVGVQASQFLKSFVKSIKEGTLMDDSLSNVEKVVKTLFSVLHNVFEFLTDHLNHYGNDENMVFGFDDVVKGDKKTIIFKQTMMREQGVLTQILNIIELCGNGDLEHLPDNIRRRRPHGGHGTPGKQNTKNNAAMLKSPTSRQLIKATSTFKTLVSQLSQGQDNTHGGAKERSIKNMAKMTIQRGLSRQGSVDYVKRKNSSFADETSGITSNTNSSQRRNSLLGLKMVQESSNDRRNSVGASARRRGLQSQRSNSANFSRVMTGSFDGKYEGKSPMNSIRNQEDLQNLVKGLRTISHDISVVCLKTLLAIIEDNHSNQMFIADKFPIILHQIKDHALAVTCVQEMLHDNLQMLQTKVREREIAIFLDLLEESEMNITLLQLLRSTCSCPMGVDSTQRMIATALLGSNDAKNTEESKDSLLDDSVPMLVLPKKLYTSTTAKPSVNVMSRLSEEKSPTKSSKYHNLLVTVSMAPLAKERGVTWPHKSIYLPDDHSMCSFVLGYELIHEGIPRLSVNWNYNNDFHLSMLNAFGFPKDVPYEYLCNISRYDSIRNKRRKDALLLENASATEASETGATAATRRNSLTKDSQGGSGGSSRKLNAGRKKPKRSTINNGNRLSMATAQKAPSFISDIGMARKIQVADYFCAQLYLMADLCLDRNYIAMKLVEVSFPYEMLISMLKIPNSSQRFKAPVCRLLKCLYVDREPQSEAKFPRLIRTSVSLSGGEENAFEDHHEGSPYKFSILQQIISDYIIHELDTTNCDELSAEMMELLLSLIKFGFYSSLTQLQDIIVPLTKALGDHRNVSKRKPQRKKHVGGSDTAGGSTEDVSGVVVERRNAMPINLKATDLQALKAPSLAQSLFGVAISSPRNADTDDEYDDSNRVGFWDSFRKLGKSSVSPDNESASNSNKDETLTSRITGIWTKIAAPLAFMSTGQEQTEKLANQKSPRVQMMKDLKTSSRSSKKFFMDDDNIQVMTQENSRDERSDKGGKRKSIRDTTWERYTLQFTETQYFVAFFVFLVLASTSIAIIQVSRIEISFFTTQMQVIVDLSFTLVFLIEVLTRMYCTYVVHHEILSFFTNPLKFVDVLIVVLDVFILIMDVLFGGQGSYVNAAKFLRIVRMFRIVRVVRAARLINTLALNSYRHQQYVIPERYNSTTEFEVRTIIGIIKVMSTVHDRIQDRKLGLCIQYFSDWFNDAIMNKARDPKDVYAQLCSDAGMTNAFPPKFDAMLVDVVMYNDSKLTNDALSLLMVHESQEELFLTIAKQVQIIYSSKLERLYRSFVSDLKKLKSLAESYELWGASVDNATDLKPAEQIIEILNDLCSHLCVKPEVGKVESGFDSERDAEVQQLLYNLDSLSVFMLIEHSLLDGQLVEPNDMIRKIIRLCNETVILFVKDNEVNQNLAFKYFSWFLDRIDDKLGSSRVSKAIITGNRNLMKQCPKTILSDLMKNIVTRGRKPEYLDLLVGMTEIVDNGDSGVISLRHEISRSVTNRDRVKFLIEWCDASGTPGYEERKAAMAPFVGLTMPVSNLDLPEQLQYHINLLTLLSGLKLGQKLQAVYAIEDIIAAILDDNTIHNVKKCLGILLEELVENKIDGLDSSECIWEYFMYCEKMFDNLLTELPEFMSRDKFHLRFQKAEWIQSTLLVIIHFFDNFDFLVFRETAFDSESAFKVTPSSESDIQLVIFNLHHSMKSIKRIHSNRLGMNLTLAFEEAVSSLSHLIVQVSKEEETKTIPQGRRASLVGGKARATDNRGHGIGRADEIHEAYYRKQYLTFLEALHVNHEMSNLQAMKIFEKLPSIKDSGESDVRLEYFIVKISSHIRSQVTSSGSAKTMASEAVTSAKWVLDTWTHLIQKEFGQIALNDLADPQRIVELPPYTHFQEILNNCGATVLCLDLIAINMDPQLILGAMKLLVVLLSGSGGNSMVQQSIFEWLYETDSAMFFEQMKDLLEQQMMWCQRRAEMKATADRVDTLPDSILCLKVLSAMCDNFCLSNKNVVREQNGNSRFVNLLDSLAAYVDLLSRLEDHTCVKIASRVIHTILCFVQGPCKGNQEYFVLHTNLLSALNRIMRLTQSSIQIRPREWSDDIEILKEYAFELLHACIEGQHAGSVVLERVQVAMELNVLNVLIIPSELDEFGDVIELSELSDLQATYLVFLQNLSSNNKSIEIPLNAKRKIESDVARIEVIWNREVAVHYFNVPPIAMDITGPSKDRLIEMVELSTQEAKLKDFLRRSKDLYREAVHFQRLKSLGIVDIWNFKHKLSWIMLFNVLIMNVLLVVYYTTDSVDEIYLPDDVNVVVYALNAFHIMFSLCTLITYLIVRVPVLYWSFREYGDGGLVAFFKAITDPMPLWYSVYLAVSVLSLLKNYLLLSFLLLDFIVMDSTSRDIMNAVIYPARQLATALIIIMIMVNMFSGAVFYYFRHDFDFDDVDGKSLFDTFKLLITFGVRANEGVGAYMTPNIHSRFILDMFFFLIIVVILMNIFFGIIIDTFGKLRNLKVDREADEANKCFICGVEEHYFLKHTSHDLDSSANEGFKYHRRVTHNMWNYLYFAMKIWQQPRDLDNSVEMHVRSCMERGDISWFPIGIFNTDTNNSSLAMIGDAGNAMAPSTKILALSDNGDGKAKGGVGGGLPSSPRKGNDSSGGNNSNNASLMQDFARLEETLNQKLNSLNENIATLTSFSVQNTLDENYAADAFGLDNRKSNRLSNANSVNSPRKRESSLNKSSKRESSSFNKITNVADTVRAAMAQAVFKRQLAQKHLAELEEEVKSPVKEGLSSQFVAPTHHEKTVLAVDTDPKDTDIIEIEEGAPPHSEKKMTISPSTRMMEMMRSCFQEELSPLKNQLKDLSVRVGHLEKRTEKEVLPQRRDSVNEEVEILIDHDFEKEKESTTPRKGSLKKSTIGDLTVKNHATPSKVHFKDTVIVTAKSSSDDSKRSLGKPKGLKGEIARLTNVGKEKGFLTKQDKKKLDTTTKLAHAYLDGSLPRVKTSPTTNQQSVPITNASKMSSSSHSTVDRPRTSPSPTRKREIEKSKKVQEAFDELAIIKSVGLDELDCEEDFSAVLPHVQGNDITPQKDGDESVNDLKSGVLKEDEISEVRATSPADSD